jgi:hypothetical protein
LDVRRRERHEEELAAQAAAVQAKPDQDTTRQRAQAARIEALRSEFGRYARHCFLVWGVKYEEIPKFDTWCRINASDRARIMAKINKELEDEDRKFFADVRT